MIDTNFYHTTPCDDLYDDREEYHIHWDFPDLFGVSFKSNTGKHFVTACREFIMDKFGHKISESGIDGQSKRDVYVWLHLPKNSKEVMKSIQRDLQAQYNSVWSAHNIPKLSTLTRHSMKTSNMFMASAINFYQRDHGFDKTRVALRVLFETGDSSFLV